MRVGVIGTGRVGLVVGACLSNQGHAVVCHDRDEEKIARLEAGRTPFFEPQLDQLVAQGMATGCLRFSGRMEDAVGEAEVVFICVGTPLDGQGSLDLSAVTNVADQIADLIQSYAVIVLKSTVPVGTAQMVKQTIRGRAREGVEFDVVSMPEFLREGAAVEDFRRPVRLVIGCDSARAKARVLDLLGEISCPVIITRHQEAELIKQVSNCFLAVKLSFANTVAAVCERLAVDVTAITRGVGADPRIGPTYLSVGMGYGGSCLPKDMEAFIDFARRMGCEVELLSAAQEVNSAQTARVVEKLREELGTVAERAIGLLGLAFNPGTDTLIAAPSLELVRRLRAEGARVRVFDPVAMDAAFSVLGREVEYASDEYDLCRDCDAVVLVTEWPRFAEMDLARVRASLKSPVIIDGRNLFDPVTMAALGFRYRGVGRGYAGALTPPPPAASRLAYLEHGDNVAGGKRTYAG
jgi:UDPglucose 6-dehydrogenase